MMNSTFKESKKQPMTETNATATTAITNATAAAPAAAATSSVNPRILGKTGIALLTCAFIVACASPAFALSNRVRPALRAESPIMSRMATQTRATHALGATPEIPRDTDAKKAFREALAPLHESLQALRVESTDSWQAIAALNRQIQQASKEVRTHAEALPDEERLALLEQMKLELTTPHNAIVETRTGIRDIQTHKSQTWSAFRTTLQENDTNAAQAALTSILEDKEKILALQQTLLEYKQDLLTALESYLPKV